MLSSGLRRAGLALPRAPRAAGGAASRLRLYHENIVDHYESPRNVGSLPKNDPSVGTGLVGAPACGDVMKLQMRVGADGKIEEAVFKTFGCGSAIASSSYTTEWSAAPRSSAPARPRRRALAAPRPRRALTAGGSARARAAG